MNKALIVAPSWIGDTIMAQPLFARLCARHPGLQLDALAPRWVAPVLQRMAEIHEVIDSPFGHGQLSIKARWRLGRDLAARGYDAVHVLPTCQIGPGAVAGRHTAARGLYRRIALRPDQRSP